MGDIRSFSEKFYARVLNIFLEKIRKAHHGVGEKALLPSQREKREKLDQEGIRVLA